MDISEILHPTPAPNTDHSPCGKTFARLVRQAAAAERKRNWQKSENQRLRAENKLLKNQVAELRGAFVGMTLEANLHQDLDPPGDWEDYPFSLN